jgi:hypothetical protein
VDSAKTGLVSTSRLNPEDNDQTWAGLRTEFMLPPLQQLRRRLSELMEDPEPVMRQLVRVLINDGIFGPGFQLLPGGQLLSTVHGLFQRAMEVQIPPNYFTLWMVTPSRDLAASRPVAHLNGGPAPCFARWNPTAGRL